MTSTSLSSLVLLALSPTLVAGPQTEILYTIERPPGVLHDWAGTMQVVPDLNGDGVVDLALAGRQHGGAAKTRVFSGADGSPLFEITQANHILFWGRGIAGVSDQSGDGIPEIVIVGFQSGDANSPEGRIHVHSGADGSLVRELLAPPGVALREGRILALDDADGDGYEDILIRTIPSLLVPQPRLQLFSSVTGAPLYDGVDDPSGLSLTSDPIRTTDHDGDGNEDFLVGVSLAIQGDREVHLRSGSTGETLAALSNEDFDILTGNGEPLVRMTDLDGDQLDDFAIGGVFFGHVGTYSSADATLLREWSCEGLACLGALLINPGDLNGDGHEDLITIDVDTSTGTQVNSLVGLDHETGLRIFEEQIPGISPGYGTSDSLVAMPGVDRDGAPTFALFEPESDHLSVRRFAFSLGNSYCEGLPNSTGSGATISASGSSSIQANDLRLTALGVPSNSLGIFYYGGAQARQPFGDGLRCVGDSGSGVFRLPVQAADDAGHLHFTVDNTSLPAGGQLTAGATRNFQGWYRDPAAGGAGFNLTDGLELSFLP